jgi:hypothetical protein
MTSRARGLIALLALAIVAVLVWLLFIQGDNSSETSATQKTVANYTASELPGAVSSVGSPVYWLGPEPGMQYELTLITDGRSYVRYLPEGAPAESQETFRTVGTYAFQNPTSELERLGKQSGNHTFDVPGGGIGMAPGSSPQHVYVAFPGQKVEIEVFDPRPGSAEKSVKSGQLRPVG